MYRQAQPQRQLGLSVAPSPPDTYLAPPPELLTPAMLVRMILRRKALVLACGLAFAALGLAWGKLVPAKYLAAAQVIVDPTDLRVTDRSLRTPNQFNDALIAQVENQVRVITSESVMKRLVATERLDEDPEFNGTAPPDPVAQAIQWVKDLFGKHEQKAPSLLVAALRKLDKTIAAKREERTYVVGVSAETLDPEKSVRLADAVVDAFVAETAEARDEVSKRVAGSLDARLGQLKNDVEQAERRVEEYRRQNNIVTAIGQSVTEQQLANANARLGSAQTGVAQAQSRYDQVLKAQRGGDGGAIPDALQSQTVMNLRTQFTEVQRRVSDVTATRGTRHPEVIEVRAQEATVRKALAAELARIATAAKTDLDRARADEREMQRSFDAMKAAVNAKDAASVRLRELERAATASRSVYETFLTRTREVSEQEKVDPTNIRIISRAQLPERRSSPPRTLLLVVGGLILGLCLGAGIAMVRGMVEGDVERLDPRRHPSPGFALVRS